MTTLINTIKQNQLQARKNKDATAASLLTTLIGESEMVGKNDGNRESTDAEVTAVIKKFVKNIDETISALSKNPEGNADRIATATKEKDILMAYLPKQLDEAQLRAEMQKIITELSLSSPKGMGVLMKELKNKFPGAYDGNTASKIAKEVLV